MTDTSLSFQLLVQQLGEESKIQMLTMFLEDCRFIFASSHVLLALDHCFLGQLPQAGPLLTTPWTSKRGALIIAGLHRPVTVPTPITAAKRM